MKTNTNGIYVVVNDWDGSDEFTGTYDECWNFVYMMSEITTQNYTVLYRTIP